MKLFNKYIKEDNFRWVGFYIFKTAFGFGFSISKPIWYIPYFEFILNDKNIHNNCKKYFSISFGWLFFCFRVQILHGIILSLDNDSYTSVPPKHVKYVKTRYIYKGKGKPLPYMGDI
jgi:hypothetical protein